MNVWDLKMGDLFRLPDEFEVEGPNLFTYRSMDGMYCYAIQQGTEKVFNWNGPVEKVES